ncbi:uncharacterized protein LOC117635383 [Prunus dulcis]|uniref:uncharacterized protein LOC117635383 n=1 Tax=Prunus dulcis TaxID=3755 RepID=UPI0014839FC4|nr:uncharacterized protein LOC117635383 [Prunus dulcis]
MPSVVFGETYFVENKEQQIELLNSLDRYLFSRGDNRMQRFCINWNLCWEIADENIKIITWIHNAVRCNVEVLHLALSVRTNTVFELPSCIFLSQSLRSLSVHSEIIFQVPSLSFSGNLHYLKLKEVKIEDERFFKWISFSCKCIKELQLIRIRGMPNITIESASLESFKVWSGNLFHLNIFGEKLKDIHIVWRKASLSSNTKSFNMFAPNLRSLKWEGNFMSSQHLGKLTSLEKAGIFMESELNDCDNIFKVICSMCRGKVSLNQWTVKALVRGGSMPAAPLVDICNLSLHIRNLNDDLITAVVFLLGGMPNLNTLHIKCTFSSGVANYLCSGIDMEYWKIQGLAFIYQLKEATLELSNGFNGIEFARYILEHAPNLEKMVIFHLQKYSDDVWELKDNVISNAIVVSQVRKPEKKSWSDFV